MVNKDPTTCNQAYLDENFIGQFIVADGTVWRIISCYTDGMIEAREFGCQRADKTIGSIQKRVFYEGDEEVINIHPTWVMAELARLNSRIDRLERMLDELSDTFDEVRNAYRLY